MNTVIIISWWARTVTVFFTDIEGVYYTLDLGKVTSFRGGGKGFYSTRDALQAWYCSLSCEA